MIESEQRRKTINLKFKFISNMKKGKKVMVKKKKTKMLTKIRLRD
jgi:hypothetical protein